ncbi:MAG: ACP S-malonyltransferase [Rhizonema sp. NSF051]|nr:ACP S-malonyltransferase [Rhizonema sp. NSF051]
MTFNEIALPTDSNDRIVWRFAQENLMILLIANRSMKEEDSLEQILREENTSTSLPVITISNVARLDEPVYRHHCVNRLIEVVLDIDDYRGSRRIFIP